MGNLEKDTGAILDRSVELIIDRKIEFKYKLLEIGDLYSLGCLEAFFASLAKRKVDPELTRILMNHIWEIIHSYHWCGISDIHRELYCIAAIMSCCFIVSTLDCEKMYRKAIRLLDHAILTCRPKLEYFKLANSLIVTFQRQLQRKSFNTAISAPITNLPRSLKNLYAVTILPTSQMPDVLTFYDKFFCTQKAVVLLDCIQHWPALRKWNNVDYILDGKHSTASQVVSFYVSLLF